MLSGRLGGSLGSKREECRGMMEVDTERRIAVCTRCQVCRWSVGFIESERRIDRMMVLMVIVLVLIVMNMMKMMVSSMVII